MHAQKTLILILILVAAGAGIAGATECDIEGLVVRLVADATAAELPMPGVVAAIAENGGIRLVRETITVEVSTEECASPHVLVTIARAWGKAALKGAAILIRHVL